MRKSQRKTFKESIKSARKALMLAVLCPMLASMVSCSGSSSSEETGASEGCGKEMGAIECIMTRSSIRSWSDQKVSRDTLEIILKAAMASPTAVNLQPWAFVVVESDEARATLAEATNFNLPKEAETKNNRPQRPNFVAEAPVTIVVCGNRDKFMEGVASGFWVEDTSAATENLLLAAHALGLGAVWCGLYPLEDRVESVTKALDLPENLIPMCYVPMGYPDVEPNIKDKWNPQNVMWK